MQKRTVVIGASYGGMNALKIILSALPKDFHAPILIVQHVSPQSNGFMLQYLASHCSIKIKEADEKENIHEGYAYFAPPNYHMLVDYNGVISFTVEEKVNYARPSIDVLFESAVDAYGPNVIGVILTGANSDGSLGLKRIKENGGIAIVQNPEEADSDIMPKAAIAKTKVDYILNVDDIAKKLIEIVLSFKE